MAKIKGEVVSVSAAGDLITNISLSDLAVVRRGEEVLVCCDGHVTAGIFPQDHGQPDMTLVALEGVSGNLELSLVGDNASRFLSISPGAEVTLEWR